MLIFFDNWDNLDLGLETLKEKFDSCKFNDDIKRNVNIALKYEIKGYTYNNKIEDLYKDMSNNGIIID